MSVNEASRRKLYIFDPFVLWIPNIRKSGLVVIVAKLTVVIAATNISNQVQSFQNLLIASPHKH